MEISEMLDWLKENRLMDYVQQHYRHFLKIYSECLDVKDERILLIGDYGFPERRVAPVLIGCYIVAAKELGLEPKIAMQQPKIVGEAAESDVVEQLAGLPEGSIIIQAQSGRIGSLKKIGKSYRRFCNEYGHRFVSTMSLGDIDTFLIKRVIQPINIDYDELKERNAKIKALIDQGKHMRITTKAGTDLDIDIDGITAISNDGIYNLPSSGGNIPAGEVYLAPANCNGKLVIDVSSRNSQSTALIQRPVEIIIKDNIVISIDGGDEAELLNKSLLGAEARAKYPERVRTVAEIGIGTNTKAKILGSTIVDEKAYGTAHLAIGSNYWFGGNNRTIIHLDQVFAKPNIWIDGEKIRI